MVNVMRKLLALTILLLAGMSTVSADVNVSRTPTSIAIPLGQASAITVTWILSPSCFATPAGGTVSSPNGVLLVGSTPTALGNPFSRAMTSPGPTVQFVDTVLVPQSATIQAVKLGLSSITYSRTFTSTNNCTFPSSS